ncbi:hypothetical protein BX600DRAFT_493588 [Xylariales sp. PMI_506]|nr:hypothetical protein BX600DRAFT_493588 [Xylariales sp. PMI_506]
MGRSPSFSSFSFPSFSLVWVELPEPATDNRDSMRYSTFLRGAILPLWATGGMAHNECVTHSLTEDNAIRRILEAETTFMYTTKTIISTPLVTSTVTLNPKISNIALPVNNDDVGQVTSTVTSIVPSYTTIIQLSTAYITSTKTSTWYDVYTTVTTPPGYMNIRLPSSPPSHITQVETQAESQPLELRQISSPLELVSNQEHHAIIREAQVTCYHGITVTIVLPGSTVLVTETLYPSPTLFTLTRSAVSLALAATLLVTQTFTVTAAQATSTVISTTQSTSYLGTHTAYAPCSTDHMLSHDQRRQQSLYAFDTLGHGTQVRVGGEAGPSPTDAVSCCAAAFRNHPRMGLWYWRAGTGEVKAVADDDNNDDNNDDNDYYYAPGCFIIEYENCEPEDVGRNHVGTLLSGDDGVTGPITVGNGYCAAYSFG